MIKSPTPEQVAKFNADQERIREAMGFAGGKPVVCRGLDEFKDVGVADDVVKDMARVPPMVAEMELPQLHEMPVAQVCSYLQPATAMLFRLVIAHDGSLAAALSKAIVARAEEIGVAGLADLSAPSLSSSTLDSPVRRTVADGDPK